MRVAACAVVRLSLRASRTGGAVPVFSPESARGETVAPEPHAHRRPPATRLPPPATPCHTPATPAWSAKDRSDRPCAIADCLARACAGVTRREAHASDVDTSGGTEGVAQALRDALSNDATRIIELFKEWDEDRNGYVSKKEWCREPRSMPTTAPPPPHSSRRNHRHHTAANNHHLLLHHHLHQAQGDPAARAGCAQGAA